jgi:hypothetical protein
MQGKDLDPGSTRRAKMIENMTVTGWIRGGSAGLGIENGKEYSARFGHDFGD